MADCTVDEASSKEYSLETVGGPPGKRVSLRFGSISSTEAALKIMCVFLGFSK